jgi:acetylglutamate kinase
LSQSAAGPLVVKIGGAGVDTPSQTPALWRTIADMHAILGGQLLLVHGGGRAVDQHLERLGMTTERRDGIRITPPNQVAEIAAVLAGRVNKLLVGALQACGIAATGLCLSDGAAVRTRLATFGFDAGRVGEVSGGDGRLLRMLMQQNFLPVLCSIGLDDAGELLNVNADDAAAGVARILGARALVLLTDVPGILDGSGARIETTTAAEIDSLIARGTIHGGMIPKVRAAVAAAESAGAPAVIASWKSPQDLLAIAAGSAAGTRIVPAAGSSFISSARSPAAIAPSPPATSSR